MKSQNKEKGKLAARNKRIESIVLHSTYRNTHSLKALALISKNHPLSFGHRTHTTISSQAAGRFGPCCYLPTKPASWKLQAGIATGNSHCSTGEAPVEGSLENIVFVLQCA